VDSYTDEHYDVTLSVGDDGKPKIERIYGNKRLSELQGPLKVFVKAESFSETEEMLHFDSDPPSSRITIAFFNIRGSLIKHVSPLIILTPESLLRAANDTWDQNQTNNI
jgi:hypothetical protein